MTTATLSNRTMTATPRPSLEELVDRLMAALFGEETPASPSGRETAAPPAAQSVARSVHDARRMRQAGDPDGALAVLAGVDMTKVEAKEARWAYAEWLGLARRRFGGQGTLLYSQGAGRAAALVPHADGTMEVVAVLGMRWRPGKVVSRRSLRGLRPLNGGA